MGVRDDIIGFGWRFPILPDARGRLGLSERPYPQADYLRHAWRAAAAVDAGAVAAAATAEGLAGEAIRQRVQTARCAAIAHATGR